MYSFCYHRARNLTKRTKCTLENGGRGKTFLVFVSFIVILYNIVKIEVCFLFLVCVSVVVCVLRSLLAYDSMGFIQM